MVCNCCCVWGWFDYFCRVFNFFFFKQKTAYEMRISDWSSDVCSSDLSREGDYAPEQLLPQIDVVNAEIYDAVNNGVYKVGFATEQDVYEQEVDKLFAYIDKVEIKLGHHRYLLGD